MENITVTLLQDDVKVNKIWIAFYRISISIEKAQILEPAIKKGIEKLIGISTMQVELHSFRFPYNRYDATIGYFVTFTNIEEIYGRAFSCLANDSKESRVNFKVSCELNKSSEQIN